MEVLTLLGAVGLGGSVAVLMARLGTHALVALLPEHDPEASTRR